MARHRKQQTDEKQSSEKRKKRSSQQRRKSNFNKRDLNATLTGVGSRSNCNDYNSGGGGDGNDYNNDGDDDEIAANLNRVLVERMLLKNSGFNQGSRSVGGTPICLRRKRHDVNKNLSPLRLNDGRSSAVRLTVTGDPVNDIVKRRSNSVRVSSNYSNFHLYLLRVPAIFLRFVFLSVYR